MVLREVEWLNHLLLG